MNKNIIKITIFLFLIIILVICNHKLNNNKFEGFDNNVSVSEDQIKDKIIEYISNLTNDDEFITELTSDFDNKIGEYNLSDIKFENENDDIELINNIVDNILNYNDSYLIENKGASDISNIYDELKNLYNEPDSESEETNDTDGDVNYYKTQIQTLTKTFLDNNSENGKYTVEEMKTGLNTYLKLYLNEYINNNYKYFTELGLINKIETYYNYIITLLNALPDLDTIMDFANDTVDIYNSNYCDNEYENYVEDIIDNFDNDENVENIVNDETNYENEVTSDNTTDYTSSGNSSSSNIIDSTDYEYDEYEYENTGSNNVSGSGSSGSGSSGSGSSGSGSSGSGSSGSGSSGSDNNWVSSFFEKIFGSKTNFNGENNYDECVKKSAEKSPLLKNNKKCVNETNYYVLNPNDRFKCENTIPYVPDPNKVNCEMNDLNNLDLGNLYKQCGTKPNIEVYNQYGYSYMPPQSWSVPQERPAKCNGNFIPNPQAIYTEGAPIDALKWNNIMPKFKYTEVDDPNQYKKGVYYTNKVENCENIN